MTGFSYEAMTGRNIGFVTEAEQERLAASCAFVCGTGGMGGACVMSLARAGVGRLILADIDTFDETNINRQVFATQATVGRPKAEATADALLQINPGLILEVHGAGWPETAGRSVEAADVVVNGTDDLAASLLLYRTARGAGRSVVDAYASPLPSIYVTTPRDPMPEERLGYPTVGTAWDAITDEQRRASFLAEALHVLVHSSSRHHIDLALAGEVAAGRRPRPSFAPMVILTGQLMAYEAIAAILGRPHGADARGWFLNPYAGRVERPRGAIATAIMTPIARRALARLAGGK